MMTYFLWAQQRNPMAMSKTPHKWSLESTTSMIVISLPGKTNKLNPFCNSEPRRDSD